MTTKDYTKAFAQLNAKPAVKAKFERFNKPKTRQCGEALKKCRRCGRTGAHISKYRLHYCRQCFRELAKIIGFRKY